MRPLHHFKYQFFAVFLALIAVFCTLKLANAASRSVPFGNPRAQSSTTPSPTPTASLTPSPTPRLNQRRYLPLVMSSRPPDVELQDAWTSNPAGSVQQAFHPGDGMSLRSSGLVNVDHNLQAHLRWVESGPCGSGEIFSGTVTLKSGRWEHTVEDVAPECAGIYSSTVHLQYESQDDFHNTKFVVNEQDSTIQLSVGHGFDRCYLPDLETMQSWMDSSPYDVFNLYIGGISFACKKSPVDAPWVYSTSSQGWAYILTWVGPQAPCTNFTHRMSSNPETAYNQGKGEAEAANVAAISLGFQGNKVIYYDMEGYAGDQHCRNAVREFMRGWTERLQALGSGAGGYGGACSSFVSDWAESQPPPDDVWIAHWYKDEYDPEASVWKAPCVSDDLWANSQRTKQYAGGHRETWGGDSLTIDSNKFEGKTVIIPRGSASASSRSSPIVESSGPDLQQVGLVSSNQGWAVSDNHLYWSWDGGKRWLDITPVQLAGGRILGTAFMDESHGWVVANLDVSGSPGIVVLRTEDGGQSWLPVELAGLSAEEIQTVDDAYLNFVDAKTAWVVLKLATGSSFSLGRLYATQDGGFRWEERSAPAGDPVSFRDAQIGWMVAGPAQDALYRTQDGGLSWHLQNIVLPFGGQVMVGLPRFDPRGTGWLPVISKSGTEENLVYYTSRNGGESWMQASGSMPEPDILQEALLGTNPAMLPSLYTVLPGQADLSEGAYWVDFVDERTGWAATRSGSCQRDSSGLKRCELTSMLLSTLDGGQTWEPVCSPDLPCFEGISP